MFSEPSILKNKKDIKWSPTITLKKGDKKFN